MPAIANDKPRARRFLGLPEINEMVSVNGKVLGRVFGYRLAAERGPWEVQVELAEGISVYGTWCKTTHTAIMSRPSGVTSH